MKPLFVLFLTLTVGILPASAQGKAVPQEVLSWYKDSMGLYADLVKGLDKAKDAKETATVYRRATGVVQSKNLVARYKALMKKYPRFFDDSEDETWVPPADWLGVMEDYSETMETYGQGMQKAMAYYEDPQVQKALQAFAEAWGEMGEVD